MQFSDECHKIIESNAPNKCRAMAVWGVIYVNKIFNEKNSIAMLSHEELDRFREALGLLSDAKF